MAVSLLTAWCMTNIIMPFVAPHIVIRLNLISAFYEIIKGQLASRQTQLTPSMVSHRGHNCISSALTILDSALTS